MTVPQSSRTYLSLNGRWQIAQGPKDASPEQWTYEVPVPGLVDLATGLSSRTAPNYDWAAHEYHWYRTTFTIPESDRSALAFLKIDQAMFGTSVWLNGIHIGCDIACYTSQEYDIFAAMKFGVANELLVRVGGKSTLPPESAVGKDQERTEFIPGIWGDVSLILSGNPRVKLVQIIPHIDRKRAEVRITVANSDERESILQINAIVSERQTKRVVSSKTTGRHSLGGHREVVITLRLPVYDMYLWSVHDPFLYELDASITVDGRLTDSVRTAFGMREFKVVGGDFFFNGKRIFLRGGNIAFHRFLSDADRGSLPWDPDWIKRALIDIPKAHNFNFFRNHIGHMYNRWYDVADEHGMLLQDEWPFWTTTGTKEQITNEFTRWLQDNWNHPSIIIWDALNECSDATVQNEIIPQMKRLDPTRPWESVDFIEQHPYIYSLGPVLNEQRFGFTMALDELETLPAPSVVNEFLWWWLDREWKPTALMQGVIERWLGKDYTKDELVERQSFLAQELVELFRRMRIDAIQPFVYISNNAGPTANWFLGDIKDLQPKPVLEALKNAFSPFGISLEIWDRHFLVGESRALRLFIFNDEPVPHTGTVRYGVIQFDDGWTYDTTLKVSVEPGESLVSLVQIMLPRHAGEYRIRAELLEGGNGAVVAYTEKIAHVFDAIDKDDSEQRDVAVCESSGEIARFLSSHGFAVLEISELSLGKANVLIVGEGKLATDEYQSQMDGLSNFVNSGGTLVVIEPEFGVNDKGALSPLQGLALTIERRADMDKGGYDSYVFAEDLAHPLWSGIEKKHLQMFNGGFGGEVVSQYDVTCSLKHHVLARCGLKLGVEAVFEIPYGKGTVIVSRLQLRGRLVRGNEPGTLYARRPDPVLQRYLVNLVGYASTR